MPAHRCKLKFELKIRNRPQAANDALQTAFARKIDCEPRVSSHFYIDQIMQNFSREVDALLKTEQRRLSRVGSYRDNDLVEDIRSAAHEIVMPVGNWIESPRIHGVGHC